MPLPIGFFMPLPLPIMIPFMMWQSAAIAAGFGTYFQFAKRRVSAMSNEEFNNSNPHDLVNSMYTDIVANIPSSFAKVDNLTPVMLQSMNTMLDQAVKWLQGAITGNIFGTPNPFNPATDDTGLPSALPDSFTPGETGQTTIPSISFLNSLNREQLKAIRNDALRGDYTEDSKKLILARYKEIFEFDKSASVPDAPKQFEGFFTDAKSIIDSLPDTFRSLNKLQLAAAKKASSITSMVTLTNRFYGLARDKVQALVNAKKTLGTAFQVAKKLEQDWLAYLVFRNKAMLKGLPFRI